MTSVRSLLARVARLEAARVAPRSPFEVAYGGFGGFEEKVTADIAARKLDGTDAPLVLNAVRNWHRDMLWSGFRYHNNGQPQYAAR